MSHAYRKTKCIDNLAEMRVVQITDLLILNDPMPMMESLLAFDKNEFFFSSSFSIKMVVSN